MLFDNASLATLVINFPLFLLIINAGRSDAAANAPNTATPTTDTRENITVFLKSWPFRFVRKECESSFLYNYGYTSVLVSSIQDKTLQRSNPPFNELFKFRTPLGTIDEFADMIKSCGKKGIKIYVSLKLITDKQIERVIKRYEEIEPFLLKKLYSENFPNDSAPTTSPNDQATNTDTTSKPQPTFVKTPNQNTTPSDENSEQKRQHKNTKYLMELVLLYAFQTQDQSLSSLLQSFKQINTRYRLNYKRVKLSSEKSGIPQIVRKYCKLKYNLEDISSAVQFIRYLAELGVSGVRIENSRYIDTKALRRIFNAAQKNQPRKLAIIFDDVGNVKHYQKYGSIMEEEYARNMMDAVKTVNFKKLVSKNRIWPENWNVAFSNKSRPYVPKYMIPEDNKDDSHNFKIATSMMLANPHGFPIIVSPFSRLKNRVKSLPNVDNVEMQDICSGGKYCIHRKKYIRQLALFRLITAGRKITTIKAPRNNVLYLNRGNKGFAVFIHRTPPTSGKQMGEKLKIQTELPPGLYCNVITGYPELTRDKCHPSSVLQVDMKRRIVIKNPKTYRNGVIAIDILSRLKYMDIEANGKYILQTKPSKLLRNRGQNTSGVATNYKPRDLDDLNDSKLSPPSPAPTTTAAMFSSVESTSLQTRDIDDVLGKKKIKVDFNLSGFFKIIPKSLEALKDIIEEILEAGVKVIKHLTRRH